MHDYAFTGASKQGSEKEFAVQDAYKDFCKRLANIQPQGPVSSGSATGLPTLMEEVGYEDVACLPPPETTDVEPSQVLAVRCNHVVSRFDAPSWHDPTNIVSSFGVIGNNGLCWSLNIFGTMFAGHQWNSSDQRMHRQNQPTRSTELLTTGTTEHALAAGHLLGCLGNASPIPVTHVNASGIGRLPFITRCRTQQAYNTLMIRGHVATLNEVPH